MKFRLNNIFGIILAAVLAANLITVLIFTFTINDKLNEALEISRPQEGTLTLIASENCEKCSAEAAKKQLIELNTEFNKEKELKDGESEAEKLIKDFNIEKLPALIFENDKKIKTSVKQILESKGWEVKDNFAIWKNNPPPYYDMKSKTAVGLVDAIFLTDKSCKDCYDAITTHKSILKNFNVVLNSEKTVDISDEEGKNLLTKYSIKVVPTVIFSDALKAYEKLTAVWDQAGTVESDGSYIFRKLDLLKVKYNSLP